MQQALEQLSSLKSQDKEIEEARVKGLEALRAGVGKLLEDSVAYLRLGEKASIAPTRKKVVDQFGKADDAEHEWLQQLKKLSGKDKPKP